jgi:hypothetical protein
MSQFQRRRLLRAAGAASLGFMDPWTVNHAWAPAPVKKPLNNER